MLEPSDGVTTNADAQQIALVERRDQTAVAQGSATQAAKMDGSAGNLLKAAGGGGSGGFKLDPQAAASLAASCQAAIDKIDDMQFDLSNIGQAPNLGTLTGAQAVATYTQNVATDPQGMVQAMDSLKATLQQMHDAYVQASTNYQETNQQVADILTKIDPDYAKAHSGKAPATPSNATTSSKPGSGPNFNANA
jgi:alpha-D-ribose 1-methylphosphonate 5-triphosphate synthase subunit PhnG